MGGARQKRQAEELEKAWRERRGYWLTYWGTMLGLVGFGYGLIDRGPYVASALFLCAMILLIWEISFLKWPRSAKTVVAALLLLTYGLAEWQWLSKVAAAEEERKAMIAPVLMGWGANPEACVANIDTSQLMQYRDVLEYLASGMTHEDVLREFPYLTGEDIRACLAYAADRERKAKISNA